MGYSKEQIEKYLQRIEYRGKINKTSETLSGLQKAHLEHIPYENIDIVKGIKLSLDENDLFDKMVTRGRGGYCFEQNGLLLAVLEGMGFNVTQYCGRFILGEEGISDRRHRVLRVEAQDGVFICDVGVYGESPRSVLRFETDIVQTDGLCEYRYVKDSFYGIIEQQKEKGKDWKDIYGFTQEPWISYDFEQPSFYCERHPLSKFSSFYKIGIFKDEKSFTFIDKTFTVYGSGKVISREEIADNEVNELLRENFNLNI